MASKPEKCLHLPKAESALIWIEGNKLYYDYYIKDISFCPLCGEKL